MSLPWVLIDFEFFKVVEIAVFLAITYLISKIVSKALKKTFEKTPFPEDVEKSIIKASKYVVYVIGFFVVISFAGVDITSILGGLGAFSILMSTASTFIELALATIILGISLSTYHPVAFSFLTSMKNQDKNMGINAVFGNAGSATTPLLAMLFSILWNWRICGRNSCRCK